MVPHSAVFPRTFLLPRGTVTLLIRSLGARGVVLITLVQLPVCWDRPSPSNKASSIAVAAWKKDLLLNGIRWGAGW